jgi:hypothetical protein
MPHTRSIIDGEAASRLYETESVEFMTLPLKEFFPNPDHSMGKIAGPVKTSPGR